MECISFQTWLSSEVPKLMCHGMKQCGTVAIQLALQAWPFYKLMPVIPQSQHFAMRQSTEGQKVIFSFS